MESQKPHKHRLRDSERLLTKKGETVYERKNTEKQNTVLAEY